MHEIHLKRVYEAAEPSDGVRVLVDRLWPRGIRKADLPYDAWPKEITPSPELRKLYHRGEMPFAGFREGYAEELEASEGAAAFAVSDVLARYKWEPHFGEKPIFRALEDIFIAAQKVLK